MKPRYRWFALFLAGGLCSAYALDWKKKEITVDVKRGVEEVNVTFDFTNSGKQPVRILEVTTSCGCTTAAADSEVIAAGKGDKIRTILTVGNRTGQQEKHITVLTDEGTEPTELLLRVNIIEAAASSASPKSGT